MLLEDHKQVPPLIDLHVHLYGCLTAEDLWEIGRNNYQQRTEKLQWYANEYEKAWGYRPDPRKYWTTANGFELLKKDYEFTEKNSFARFQACFNLIIALCPLTTDNFCIQEKIIRRKSIEGLSYFQARIVIPFYFTHQEVNLYLCGLCQKVDELNHHLTMKTQIVVSLFRDNNIATMHYQMIREFLRTHKKYRKVLVGIDFAFSEEGYPPQSKKIFAETLHLDNKKQGELSFLYHVGESFNNISLASAIRWIFQAHHELKVDRLGHCIALGMSPTQYIGKSYTESDQEYYDHCKWIKDVSPLLEPYGYNPKVKSLSVQKQQDKKKYTEEDVEEISQLQGAVARYFHENKVIIECCPTSNQRIGQIADATEHPLQYFHRENLKVVICSDDPGIFVSDLQQELSIARNISGNIDDSIQLSQFIASAFIE